MTRELAEEFGAELCRWPEGLESATELVCGLSRTLPRQSFRRVLESAGPAGSPADLTGQDEQFAHSVLAQAASELGPELWTRLSDCALAVDERREVSDCPPPSPA
ncbi:hypothetical protein ABZ626_38450 [Streptomyces longispororuber]|uniref:hypothetical protein n=1 Tax=Streptomyces longispororuber TaxID=68230 RepID=UPI0033DECD15